MHKSLEYGNLAENCRKLASQVKGLEYVNLAENCRKLAGQVKDTRVKKKLESMARACETVAADRAKQLGKPAKAPRARSR
jgi:hypothetical protein